MYGRLGTENHGEQEVELGPRIRNNPRVRVIVEKMTRQQKSNTKDET